MRSAIINDHTYMPEEVLAACRALKVIVFMGTGASSYIDVAAAERLGIEVRTIKGYGDVTVAEHALALMFDCGRQTARMDRALRAGSWRTLDGVDVRGQDARRGRHRRRRPRDGAPRQRDRHERHCLEPERRAGGPPLHGCRDSRRAASQTPTWCRSISASTTRPKGIIDARRLALMRRGAMLVNTARGAVIDEPALVEALKGGAIRAAGLDVFADEPIDGDHPLAALENVTLTPHAAFMTAEASARLLRMALELMRDALEGQGLPAPDAGAGSSTMSEAPARGRLGVDVGGTFTDLLLVDQASGAMRIAKVPSTPADQSDGFMAGLAALGDAADGFETVVHGTTVGTNAVLERKGVRCALITTQGFRDTLELGRRTRPNPWGMFGSFEPIVPRERRFEVTERIDASGAVVTALDEEEVRAAVQAARAAGAEALVIHFIHAYLNPDHERRAGDIAREVWPEVPITLGSDILREVREFERGSTAALNGYIQPIMTRYLGRIAARLKAGAVESELLVMQGNGGMMTAGIAGEKAVQTVMSGPAAGVIAAARLGATAGFPNLISCDMGGTSFDIAIVRGGVAATTTEKDIAYGMPLRVPMVDIQTIGAGGGSIARVDEGGILRVGPESAGAAPGPICYGKGGREPTVTDANLLLGRIDARAIGGLDSPPDIDDVRRTVRERIGVPLGLDEAEAAAAILKVVDHQMAGAARLVSVDKGHDPRDFALFAFGGAGPMHATAIARELGVPHVLVPRFPASRRHSAACSPMCATTSCVPCISCLRT